MVGSIEHILINNIMHRDKRYTSKESIRRIQWPIKPMLGPDPR